MKRVLTGLCVLGVLVLSACSDNTANMTPAQKQYITDMQGKLDQISKSIDGMKKGTSSLTGDAKAAMEKGIDQAKAKLSEAQDKLTALKNASAQEWDKAKADLDSAFKAAGDALSQGAAVPAIPKLPGL